MSIFNMSVLVSIVSLGGNAIKYHVIRILKYDKSIKHCSKYVLFGILMDSSVLWYHVRTMPQEDQTVECTEFSVKNKLALQENVFVQVVLSLLVCVKPIFKHFSSKP